MKTNFKTKLLLGAAVTALSFGIAQGAFAADSELDGTTAAPNDVTAELAGNASSSILNAAATNNDAGQLNTNGGVTVSTINIDEDGTLGVFDGTGTGDDLTVTTFTDIEVGNTLNVVLGNAELDGTGTAGAADVVITTTLGQAGATTLTRGGTLNLVGATTTAGTSNFSVNGNTLMTQLNVRGGAAGAAVGQTVNATFGNASTDTFDTTGMLVIGGAADAGADTAGGASSATVNGAAAIGAGNLAVTGGAAADNAAGGAANLTFANGVTITGGTVTVTGGADAAAADAHGGDATLTFAGNVTSNSTLALTTGAQAAGGGGLSGDAVVNLGGNATFTTITFTDNGDGAAILNVNGTTAQTIAGNTSGAGAINVSNAAGATFTGTVGGGTGTVVINNGDAALGASATFQNTVNVASITLGATASGTGTNTVTFNTAPNDGFTVTGTVDGVIAGETNNVVISGDDILTTASAWGGVTGTIDTITVTDTATLNQGAVAITAGTIALGTGTTFEVNDAVTGNITGTGTVDVDTNARIDGNVTATALTVANGVTATIDSDDAATGAAGTVNVATITLENGGILVLGADAGGTTTVTGNLVGTVPTAGTLTFGDDAAEAESFVFNGNIGATGATIGAIEIGNNNASVHTVTTTGNIYADSIDIEAGDILNITGTTVTVSGAIDGNDASEGSVVVGNGTAATNATFSSAIGATNDLAAFKVSSGSTANISNSVLVETATDGALDIDGTVNVDVTGGNATLANTAGGDTALDGTLTIIGDGDGAFTLGGGAGEIHAGWNDKNATMNVGDSVTLADDFIVGGGATTVGDVYTVNAVFRDTNGGTDTGYNPTVGSVIAAGGNTVTVATGAKLKLGLNGADTTAFNALDLTDGVADNITWISGANAASALEAAEIAGRIEFIDTAFVSQTLNAAVSDASTLASTLTLNSTEQALGGNDTYAGGADALIGMPAANRTGNVARARQNLLLAADSEAANDIAESISPTVDAGAVIGATSFVTQTSNVTNTQLASLRDGTEATGMYAGNVTNGLRGWVQGFGLTGDQDDRDGVSGYDVDSYGVAVGMDTQSLVENWVWGLAFAYSDTDVESDGVNQTNTEIDSYQVSLYTSYDLDDRTYIAGQAGYVWGDNDQTRHNVGGIAGLSADSSYDSDVIFAGLEAGRKYMVGGNTVLTPKALVNYQHYDADGYTETGAGGLNLTTSGEEIDLFEIGVGVDASWDYQQADGSFLQPKIGVGVRHDLIGDEYQTTSTFGAGGASFQTEGFDPAQTTFNVSADLTYFSTTNWELSAGYDFEYKSDYDSHAGTLKAAYKF